MKKILFFMMAMLPLMFIGCSDDDENDHKGQLVGMWVEDTDYNIEVFHLQLNSDGTGWQWAEDNGEIDEFGKSKLIWSATENEFTGTWYDEYGDSETETLPYTLSGDRLHLGEIVYKRK